MWKRIIEKLELKLKKASNSPTLVQSQRRGTMPV
jgi:hypothetical protein